ncbi:MAG: bacteriohemerythrin [Sulfurospirillum sp.]
MNSIQKTFDIKSAIQNNLFTLYYQPKINLKTKKVESCEALIRLIINGKIISPDNFIPQAEKDGSIVEIDKWVFKKVVEDARRIFTKTFEEEIIISFNISPIHFSKDDVFKNLMNIFEKTKDFNSHFEVEITESAFIEDKQKSFEIIDRLKEEGFKFALDDFGTGYASLSYLKDLPIDTLKIDKSFIDDMIIDEKTLAIVDTILYLSKKLKIKSVAEGIENIEQADLLYQMKCDEIQGYYYSKPLPIEKFILFVLSTNKAEKENQFIRWSDKYATHLMAIDSQHIIIVNLLNKLYTVLKDKELREKTTIKNYLDIVDEFIHMHFGTEDNYMQKYNYPKTKEHMIQHKNFIKLFQEFKDTLSTTTNERNIFNLFKLLKKWFLEHEFISDKKLANFIKAHIRNVKK